MGEATHAATTLQAYLGDPALKAAMVREMRKHQKADQIVKGHYGEQNGKFTGCAIGCALHSLNRIRQKDWPKVQRTKDAEATRVSEHQRFPAELGIPIELAYCIDHFFESLAETQSQTWPLRVLQAITPGVDLSGVMEKLIHWSIVDPTYGWAAFAKTDEQKIVVMRFADTVARDWRGETVTDAEWIKLTADLEIVSEWARAWAGAGARAWAGAWAWARAGAGAWARWYQAASLELLRLLREARS